MRRRPQPDELRRQSDRPVVAVVGHVVQRDVDAQGIFQLYHLRYEDLPLRPLRPPAVLREHPCVSCGRRVAYLPDLQVVGSLEPDGDGTWRSPLPRARAERLPALRTTTKSKGCATGRCRQTTTTRCARRAGLTRVIPDLDRPGAPRRLVPAGSRQAASGLHADRAGSADAEPDRRPRAGPRVRVSRGCRSEAAPPVLTGHDDGVITINIAEADDAERERRRTAMHEPYRTLLGHMRHESGHYYWDRFDRRHAGARRVPVAVWRRARGLRRGARRYYAQRRRRPIGRTISSARTPASHPWEDWAETWAHYLHMVDTLETAAACGLSLQAPAPRRAGAAEAARPGVAAAGRVRSSDRQLVSADLRAEQPESRPRARRRLPVRPLAFGGRQVAVRRRCGRPRKGALDTTTISGIRRDPSSPARRD